MSDYTTATEELICLPIADTYVCGHDHLTNDSRRCPCGDGNLVLLSDWLNRKQEEDACTKQG